MSCEDVEPSGIGHGPSSGGGRRVLPPHAVAVVVLDRMIPFDVSTRTEVFSRTRLPDERPGYQARVCAAHDEIDSGPKSHITRHAPQVTRPWTA